MSRLLLVLIAAWVPLAAASSGAVLAAGSQQEASSPARSAALPEAHQAVVERYCITCHNDKLKTGGLALDAPNLNQVSAHPEIWERVIKKLRTGAMPPQGRPRPDAATYDGMATWLENELDRLARATPNPGRLPALHRLNRTEYQNAVRDLLALDDLPREMDIAVLLPPDDASYGFDNISDALITSPTLLESYLAAAQKISRLAIGDRAMPMIVDTYRIPLQLPQEDRLDGLPFGTRGGISIARHFPLDGEYLFRLTLGSGPTPDAHELELSLDGQRVQVFRLVQEGGRGRGRGGAGPYGRGAAPLELRQAVKAGPRVVTVTFVKKTSALTEDVRLPFRRTGQAGGADQPTLASVTISGPHAITGPGETPSRARVFTCRPESAAQEEPCAKQILTTLARRAYRRPATDEDLQVLMPFFEEGRRENGFEFGIQRALERVLVSPAFLFRIEREPRASASAAARITNANANAAAAATAWRISDIELASRLSFFLWSSIPDDELLDLAARGRLRDAATIEGQVRRMLADPRAKSLVDNFAGQWLYLRNVDAAAPDPRIFPDFDDSLRRSMRRETELFFANVVAEDRSVLDLLTADYTFVNERLARHYEIPNIYGDSFRRVSLTNSSRRGLLGHASILMVTSYSHRTSPVVRGKWMLENILGTPPPPPPPDVPALQETNKSTGKAISMREAMVQHRRNPACAACHSRMDPLGFAFENFDAIGRWRTQSAGVPIDASGALPDGRKFDGASGLLEALMRAPEQFVSTLTERLMTYALGRGVEYYDAPAIRGVVREASASDYRFASIILGIVKSTPFQMRASGVASAPAAGSVAAIR